MGKGAKKRTVWRTFSFANGANDTETVSITQHGCCRSEPQEGQENICIISNGSSSSVDEKSTRQRCNEQQSHRYHQQNNVTEQMYVDDQQHNNRYNCVNSNKYVSANNNGYKNNASSDLHRSFSYNNNNNNNNNHSNNRTYYKQRTPLSDKYAMRNAATNTTTDTAEVNGHSTIATSDYRMTTSEPPPSLSAFPTSAPFKRRLNYYKNNYYNRRFRKYNLAHYDQQHTTSNGNTNDNHIHCYGNGFTKSGCDGDDDNEKYQEKENKNGFEKPHQETNNQRQQQEQQHTFNEDEYTRISTPRSDVLFKKGYLMRPKKFDGPTNNVHTASSNGSGSVSVVSTEETASYYSMQSMSPENSSAYTTGNSNHNNNNSHTNNTSATYPNDGFDPDLSLMYSSGFYDYNGFFYVNPYVQNNFDQYSAPTIFMPYGSPPQNLTEEINSLENEEPYSTLPSSSTPPPNPLDDEIPSYKKSHSINSEEISTSSMSENASINNGSTQSSSSSSSSSPLTPPPSPFSASETTPTVRSENDLKNYNKHDNSDGSADDERSVEKENVEKILTDDANEFPLRSNEALNGMTESSATTLENYSVPYFQPLIFVPPFPFGPDGRSTTTRRGRYSHRYQNNYYNGSHSYGRFRRNTRYSNNYNRYYTSSNWSEAPEEVAVNDANETKPEKDGELNDGSTAAVATPTMEQCDIILKNTKLNSNVSEFIPQSKRMMFVPLPIPPQAATPIFFLPLASTASKLNANVPEFLPKNYKPLNQPIKGKMIDRINTVSIETNADNRSAEKVIGTNEIEAAESNRIANKTDEPQTGDKELYSQNVLSPIAIAKKNVEIKANDIGIPNEGDNDNLDKSSFTLNGNNDCKQNSHVNLKADLGDKNLINNNNVSRECKTNKNTNNIRDEYSKSIVVIDKTKKAAHVTPKKDDQIVKHTNGVAVKSAADSVVETSNIRKTIAAPITTMTYAQMVVPTKSKPIAPKINDVRPIVDSRSGKEGTKKSKSSSSPISSLSNHSNHKSNLNRKIRFGEQTKNPINRAPNDPVEWFTVDAKGKKHVMSSSVLNSFDKELERNGKVENEIKNIASGQQNAENHLRLTENVVVATTADESPQPLVQISKSIARKSSVIKKPIKTKKKPPKDKVSKSRPNSAKQIRKSAFEITEPEFEVEKQKQIQLPEEREEEEKEEQVEENQNSIAVELIESKLTEEANDTLATDTTSTEIIFDLSVFATPCNLQLNVSPRSSSRKLSTSFRSSTSKSVMNLINQFDIYQQEYSSTENRQLKEEEEMVIKVLQQLNKTADGNERAKTSKKTVDNEPELTVPANTNASAVIEKSASDKYNELENTAECFAINAKPYQNIYSSNHFLEHFFGDRNDKRNLTGVESFQSPNEATDNATDVAKSEEIDCCDEKIELDSNQVAISSDIGASKANIIVENTVENNSNVQYVDHFNLIKDLQQLLVSKKNSDQVNGLTQSINGDESKKQQTTDANDHNLQQEVNEIVIGPNLNETTTDIVLNDSIATDLNDAGTKEFASKILIEQQNNVDEIQKINCQLKVLENQFIDNVNEIVELNCRKIEVQPTQIELSISPEIIENDDKSNELHEHNIIEVKATKPTNSINVFEKNSKNDTNEFRRPPLAVATHNDRPWLRIVDTKMLQQQQKIQQTFPITAAVSLWLNQAQKEKTPEPILRLPTADCKFFANSIEFVSKRTKSDSQNSNSSIDLDCYSTDDDKFGDHGKHINDNDEDDDDVSSFWEIDGSPSLLTPQSPTPPIYNSVYGNSINYPNLLSNKNEFLSNNIISFDARDGDDKFTVANSNNCAQAIINVAVGQPNDNKQPNNNSKSPASGNEANNCSFKPPPEVCCIVM